MSVGGVFTLINNNGIQDQMLMNTEYLMKSLKQMRQDRLIALRKAYPNLSDASLIEKDQTGRRLWQQ
jgi:hypothetical protein